MASGQYNGQYNTDKLNDPVVYEDGNIRVKIHENAVTDINVGLQFRVKWRADDGTRDEKRVRTFDKAVEFAEAKFAELKAIRDKEGHFIAPVAQMPLATQEEMTSWAGAVPDHLREIPIHKWPSVARAELLGHAMRAIDALKKQSAKELNPKQLLTFTTIINTLDPQGAPRAKGEGTGNVNIAFLSSGQLPPLKMVRDVQAG